LSAPVTPLGERRRLSSTVPDHLDISREQLPQLLDVAIANRAETTRRQHLAFGAVDLEPGAPIVHVAPGSDRELAAGGLRSTTAEAISVKSNPNRSRKTNTARSSGLSRSSSSSADMSRPTRPSAGSS